MNSTGIWPVVFQARDSGRSDVAAGLTFSWRSRANSEGFAHPAPRSARLMLRAEWQRPNHIPSGTISLSIVVGHGLHTSKPKEVRWPTFMIFSPASP